MEKVALLSVSERDGIVEFATELKRLGFRLLTTSGTGKFLSDNNISSESIEEYTGQIEILDGRVKTLHPKIHAGLLAKRDNPDHMRQLTEQRISAITVAAVNLYPFIEAARGGNAAEVERMVEYIDIGGPTMIRAAAKNFKSIFAVIDPADYGGVIEIISKGLESSSEALEFRRNLAQKVFARLANYNLEIAKYFSNVSAQPSGVLAFNAQDSFSEVHGAVLTKVQTLRYGENPQQKAALYRNLEDNASAAWEQLHGKELSYNNLLDSDAALKLLWTVMDGRPTAAILKHLNPCGAAVGDDLLDALQRAKAGDPRSHFGGILLFNTVVSAKVAEEVRKDFAEIVIAPAYDTAALELLRTSKNLRVIRVLAKEPAPYESRSIEGGTLVQSRDSGASDVSAAELVSERQISPAEKRDLQFAWNLCAHVKSNAIVLVKDGMLIGVGAGQMSRIDSVELAISKARTHGHDIKGAVAASDAFFPFSDNIERLADHGVVAVIAPAGAKRDNETIAAAKKHGISLLFAADRHFRH